VKNCAALGGTGFALIAISYGLARFAWGLMLPDVTREITLTPRMAGLLSACSFAAYCLAVLAAPLLTRCAGPRGTAMISALCAAAGLLLLAVAPSPFMLAAGLLIAGLSAGFSSPSLAAAVSLKVAAPRQAHMNTLINAGTSAGVMLSVPALAWLPGGWRMACMAFGALALLSLLPLWRYIPGKSPQPATESLRQIVRDRPLQRLMAIAFVIGVVSAAWWSFGPALLQHKGVSARHISLLWLSAGAAGILGALTGPLAAKIGLLWVFRLSLLGMIVLLCVFAGFSHESGWFFPAVIVGGAGYVALSGVLLVWGAQATSSAPAIGVSVLFFMLAAGQMAGSVAFGQLYVMLDAVSALLIWAVLALFMLFAPKRTA